MRIRGCSPRHSQTLNDAKPSCDKAFQAQQVCRNYRRLSMARGTLGGQTDPAARGTKGDSTAEPRHRRPGQRQFGVVRDADPSHVPARLLGRAFPFLRIQMLGKRDRRHLGVDEGTPCRCETGRRPKDECARRIWALLCGLKMPTFRSLSRLRLTYPVATDATALTASTCLCRSI